MNCSFNTKNVNMECLQSAVSAHFIQSQFKVEWMLLSIIGPQATMTIEFKLLIYNLIENENLYVLIKMFQENRNQFRIFN